MKRYPIVKLAGDISWHPFTGWDGRGLVLIECSSRESALKHGAAFVRNNLTGVVMNVENGRQHRVTPKYVNPCLACSSLEHKTYSRKCPGQQLHSSGKVASPPLITPQEMIDAANEQGITLSSGLGDEQFRQHFEQASDGKKSL